MNLNFIWLHELIFTEQLTLVKISETLKDNSTIWGKKKKKTHLPTLRTPLNTYGFAEYTRIYSLFHFHIFMIQLLSKNN